MTLTLRTFRGADTAEVIEDLARLRIEVFRDWPYLYDGDLDYERRYLADYTTGKALVVAAFEGETMVGASTGMPLMEHADDLSTAFTGTSFDPDTLFYCAESVLLGKARGQGIYHQFFAAREAHAQAAGFTYATFCGVTRPDTHPARPNGNKPLDPVWKHFGYTPVQGAIGHLSWRDIGDTRETTKPLQFWIKKLCA
ncbi:GNAT family N-acetyltransferase [Gymnodinialimonas hymeniacidonis]|uniref:GNAT family N-acetyltransferase n=1 Tax=Gymnodinialimonas hymeniacidonis TaxID=3126508 RepID=UPI0034C5D727